MIELEMQLDRDLMRLQARQNPEFRHPLFIDTQPRPTIPFAVALTVPPRLAAPQSKSAAITGLEMLMRELRSASAQIDAGRFSMIEQQDVFEEEWVADDAGLLARIPMDQLVAYIRRTSFAQTGVDTTANPAVTPAAHEKLSTHTSPKALQRHLISSYRSTLNDTQEAQGAAQQAGVGKERGILLQRQSRAATRSSVLTSNSSVSGRAATLVSTANNNSMDLQISLGKAAMVSLPQSPTVHMDMHDSDADLAQTDVDATPKNTATSAHAVKIYANDNDRTDTNSDVITITRCMSPFAESSTTLCDQNRNSRIRTDSQDTVDEMDAMVASDELGQHLASPEGPDLRSKRHFQRVDSGHQPDSSNQQSAPIHQCAFCLDPIHGKATLLLGRFWHPEHSGCKECRRPIGVDNFVEISGNLYCEDHYLNINGIYVIRRDADRVKSVKTPLQSELLEIRQHNTVRKVRNLFTFEKAVKVNMLSVMEKRTRQGGRQRVILSWMPRSAGDTELALEKIAENDDRRLRHCQRMSVHSSHLASE